MNDNEYLQKELFKEYWFSHADIHMDVDLKRRFDEGKKMNRDFSTPTDYCALEDKLRELGEITGFYFYLTGALDNGCNLVGWLRKDRTQRVALIAEYWRSRDD